MILILGKQKRRSFLSYIMGHYKNAPASLAALLSWLERCPTYQKVVGLIPGQATYLCCWDPSPVCSYGRELIDVSLSYQCLSLCLSLSALPFSLSKINKHIPEWGLKKVKDTCDFLFSWGFFPIYNWRLCLIWWNLSQTSLIVKQWSGKLWF